MRALIVSLILTLCLAPGASAASPARIIERCGDLQTTLTELALQDQALAEQLTENYQHILHGLLLPMNQRLVDNDRSIASLTHLTSEFSEGLDEWQDDTALYINRMRAVRTINCTTEPQLFLTGLEETRSARALLAAQNQHLLDVLTEYQAMLPMIWEGR